MKIKQLGWGIDKKLEAMNRDAFGYTAITSACGETSPLVLTLMYSKEESQKTKPYLVCVLNVKPEKIIKSIIYPDNEEPFLIGKSETWEEAKQKCHEWCENNLWVKETEDES